MIWFFKTSYSYINPVGIKAHCKFLMELPGATLRYRAAMKRDLIQDSLYEGDGGTST